MTVPRIYFPSGVENGNRCKLLKENLRYVKSVLRMKEGDRLILFDGTGWEYESVVHRVSADGVDVEVIKKTEIPQRELRIGLLQALPKANKMDYIVQKATELGVDRIIPFHSTRTVPGFSPEKNATRVIRWHSIAVEAARQCGRADIPWIGNILSFEEVIRSGGGDGCRIILWEGEPERNIKDVLQDVRHRNINDIAIVIGPEGGFTSGEIEKAGKAGFVAVNLGRIILRVETASVAVLSIIQYERGFFGGFHG